MNQTDLAKMSQIQAEIDKQPTNQSTILENVHEIPIEKKPERAKSLRQHLMQLIPPELIVQRQKAGLNAVTFREFSFGKDYDKEQIEKLCEDNGYTIFILRYSEKYGYRAVLQIPNYEYIDRALDRLYKLLGEYAPEKHQQVRPLIDMSDEELDTIIEKSKLAQFADKQANIIEVKLE